MKTFYRYSMKHKFNTILFLPIAFFAIQRIIRVDFSTNLSKLGFFSALVMGGFFLIFSIYILIIEPFYTKTISVDNVEIISYILKKESKKMKFADIVYIKKPKKFYFKNDKKEKKQTVVIKSKNGDKIFFTNSILYGDWKQKKKDFSKQKHKYLDKGKYDTDKINSLFGAIDLMKHILEKIDPDNCIIEEK